MSDTLPDPRGRRTSVDTTGLRRSFTAPANATRPRTADSASAAASEGVETLYVHNSVKVVLFTASSPSRPSTANSSSRASQDRDGTQPWGSPTETTQASGPLRLYRVPGSVAFLHSGNLLHAVLPRSQCWCVDGVSKFALRIPRPNSYYRIELPADGDDNTAKVEEFKVVLAKILHYEKTPCPFTRGFHVDLPEVPLSPVRRRLPITPKAKKWKLDRIWRPEDGESPRSDNGEGSPSDRSTPVSEEDDKMSEAAESTIEERIGSLVSTPSTPPTVKAMVRSRENGNLRSFTAPAELLALGREPQSAMPATEEANEPISDTASITSTADSFYSVNDAVQARSPPSPPASIYLDSSSSPHTSAGSLDGHDSPTRVSNKHKRDVSDLTITPHERLSEDERSPLPHTPRAHNHLGTGPPTPTLASDSESALDTSTLDVPTAPDSFRLRRFTSGTSPRRALSPLPPVANLYSPPPPRPRKEFGTALVQKTMGLLIGPPAHLVALMLRIAARITNGSFAPESFRLRRAATRVPGSWQPWSEDEGDEWDEDDYGIPLHNLKNRPSAEDTSDVD